MPGGSSCCALSLHGDSWCRSLRLEFQVRVPRKSGLFDRSFMCRSTSYTSTLSEGCSLPFPSILFRHSPYFAVSWFNFIFEHHRIFFMIILSTVAHLCPVLLCLKILVSTYRAWDPLPRAVWITWPQPPWNTHVQTYDLHVVGEPRPGCALLIYLSISQSIDLLL